MQKGEKDSGGGSSTNSDGCDKPPNRLASKSKRQREMGIPTWLLFSAPLGAYGGLLSAVVLFFHQPSLSCDMVGRS